MSEIQNLKLFKQPYSFVRCLKGHNDNHWMGYYADI